MVWPCETTNNYTYYHWGFIQCISWITCFFSQGISVPSVEAFQTSLYSWYPQTTLTTATYAPFRLAHDVDCSLLNYIRVKALAM